MKTIAIESKTATMELSMEELGLIINALWQELGYQEARRGPLDHDLRESYDEFQKQVLEVISSMDAKAEAES